MARKLTGCLPLLFALLSVSDSNGPLCACGPFFSDSVFVSRGHPDGPLESFFDGNLGVILPSYWRAHLVVAYRHLAGRPLNDDEKADMKRFWERYGRLKEGPSPLESWQQARGMVPGTTETSPEKYRAVEYSFFENCNDPAFSSAAETLRQRIDLFGAASPEVREWLRAQDAVFENCSTDSAPPGPLPAGMPPLLIHDRAYQNAAFLFYSMKFEEAEAAFQKIAETAESPWQSLAHLLVARSHIRKATLEAPQGQRFIAADLETARRKLREIIRNPKLSRWHAAAEDLLSFVELRLEPDASLKMLAEKLISGGDNPRFEQDLADYTWLMDRRVQGNDPLTSWIRLFQDASASDGLRAWRENGSLAFLLAAAVHSPAQGDGARELVDALGAVPRDWPGYSTALFHRARLLLGLGRAEQARRLLDHGLDSLPLPTSSRNLFRELRLTLATDLEEFRRYAVLESRNTYDYRPRNRRELFSIYASRSLSEEAPLSVLADLALQNPWPDELTGEVAQAAWTRAVLLGEWETADRIAPLLRRIFPEARPHLDELSRAATPPQKSFVAALTLLRLPGFHAYVSAGGLRLDAADRLHAYRHNWWCGPDSMSQTYYDHYRRGLSSDELLVSLSPSRAAGFLSESEKEAGRSERQRLDSMGAGANALGRLVFDYELVEPDDPRLPEALHRVVRATRFGCDDTLTSEHSRRAYRILHRRFPGSRWARATPYWY